jgi:tetratricopeptide (TPR) repeat protein
MWILLAAMLAQTVDYQAEGLKALDTKQYESALEDFKRAVAADAKDYAAHFHLALTYSMMGNDTDAAPEYKTCLELKPGLYEAELNLGISLLRLKDAAGAITYLADAARQKPKEFRASLLYGQALLESGRAADAEKEFTTAVLLNVTSAAAEEGLGQAMLRQNRFADAEPHLRKAAAMDASYTSGLLQLAESYEKAKQPDAAIAIYREFPEDPAVQERMGALLENSGKSADAIPALESAVSKSPTAANRLALAQAYVATKQFAKADPIAAAAVAGEPENYDLRMFFGRILRDERKFAEAAPQFLAASKLKPDAVAPWNELSGVLVVAEQYTQALAALDRVRALGAETPPHYYLRGLCFDHLHVLKDALENYNKFLEGSQGKYPDEEFKARQRARIIRNELNRR